MRFTLRQLEYFVAAGEAGSITEAARRTHGSQPTVSSAVARLEKALGVELFVRHHAHGVTLTPAGTRFLGEARALLRQAVELERSGVEPDRGGLGADRPRLPGHACPRGGAEALPRVRTAPTPTRTSS